MPEQLHKQSVAGKPKPPLTHFSGLVLVGVLIVFAVFASQQDKARNRALIQSPTMGDIYKVKEREEVYTLMRVADVRGDSVGVQVNDYTIDKSSRLHRLLGAHGGDFGDTVYYYAKPELTELFDKRYILDIIRK